MATTTLEQDCSAYYDAQGVTRFRIYSTLSVLKPGDLPSTDIFVHQIVISNDPKADKFIRIGNVVDLTSIPRGRDAALVQGKTLYLTKSFLVEYPDVNQATQAKSLIAARVDQLVLDWIKYNAQFVAGNEVYLPLADSSLVVSAKNAYATAKKTRAEKETALVLAASKLTDAKAAAARAAQDLTNAAAGASLCTQNLAALDAVYSALSGYLGVSGTVDTFVTQSNTFEASVNGGTNPTYEGQVSTFTTATNTIRQTGLAALSSVRSAIQLECADQQTAVQTAAVAKVTADAAAASAQTDAILAQAEADAAASAENAALTAAIAICPDFDPASV